MFFSRFSQGTPLGPENLSSLLQSRVNEDYLNSVRPITEIREIELSPEILLEFRVVRRNQCGKKGVVLEVLEICIAGVLWDLQTLTPHVFRRVEDVRKPRMTLKDELEIVSKELEKFLTVRLVVEKRRTDILPEWKTP